MLGWSRAVGHRLLLLLFMLMGILSSLPGHVCAQETTNPNRAFVAQQLRPWGDPQGMFQTQSGSTLGQWDYALGLLFNYANNTMVVSGAGNRSQSIIGHQIAADLNASVGLLDWLDVALVMPVTLYQVGRIPNHPAFSELERGENISGFALSDMKLAVKIRALREDRHGISMSFMGYVGFPTGRSDIFNGEDSFQGGGSIFISRTMDSVGFAVNAGYRYLPATTYLDVSIQHEITYSLGLNFKVMKYVWDLFFEGTGGLLLDSSAQVTNLSLDAYAGLRFFPLRNRKLAINLGAAAGILAGYGTPAVRVLAGLMWAPKIVDVDYDGMEDHLDACPGKPGDRENKGCPWPDTDGDGVNDKLDKCVNTPGASDNKGCPWPDTDGDGFADNVDPCPKKPGPDENRGCPWPDTDGDGLADRVDLCPKKKGDPINKGCPWGDLDKDGLADNVDQCPSKPGPKDNKGCPISDRDKDGVPDNKDKCPDKAGIKVADGQTPAGCPLPDQDNDGVPDKTDQCPDKPGVKVATAETKLGCPTATDKDNDGVPDDQDQCPTEPGVKVAEGLTKLGCPKVKILASVPQRILFEFGRATIRPQYKRPLEQVVKLLLEYPTARVRIEGHSDNVGRTSYNLKLSERRARAVLRYLVRRGIPANRLEAKGYGKSKPLVSNTTSANRAKNRRVDFTVLKTPQR